MPPEGRGSGAVATTPQEQLNTRAAIFMQNSTCTTFKESEGSTGYARWRKDLLAAVAAVGEDFTLALHYDADIPVAVPLDMATVLDDTSASFPTLNLSQIRQHALKHVVLATLSHGGEALKIIKNCPHVGGLVAGNPQALRLLDIRWLAAPPPDASTSDMRDLMATRWPITMLPWMNIIHSLAKWWLMRLAWASSTLRLRAPPASS